MLITFDIPPVFSTSTGELERMNVVSVPCGKRQFNTCNAQIEVAVDTAEKEYSIIYMTTVATTYTCFSVEEEGVVWMSIMCEFNRVQ